MDYDKLSSISTAVIAFSTFLGVLFALVYYIYLIVGQGILFSVLGGIIYIDINLLFIYILKKKGVFNEK